MLLMASFVPRDEPGGIHALAHSERARGAPCIRVKSCHLAAADPSDPVG